VRTLDEELAALRRLFAQGLPGRAAALSLGWSRGDDVEALWRAAHSLGGSAPTLGFEEVGEAARALERQLARLAGCPADGRASVEAALAALEDAAGRALRSVGTRVAEGAAGGVA
jgi:HPt (histidine-containing phosphotransfer) domain-containing protein